MRNKDKDGVAVVGMSALFADARNYREFWHNILTNKSCIHDVDESRWSTKEWYDPEDKSGDKTYSKSLGKIPEVEIDLIKLGIPPTSVEVIETSQLLGVQLAEEALIDANFLGENAKYFDREKAGVIVAYNGVGSLTENWWSRLQKPKWEKILVNSGLTVAEAEAVSQKILNTYLPWQEASFPGYLANVVSGRISNRLDLNGLNYIVGAACASTLAAIRAASHELHAGTCETLLVGSVCIDSMILSFLGFSNAQALTKKDYCSPFDKDSDGMLLGEGIGFVVLKRLEDAIEASDRIYGVIRGTGAASDGKGKSIYAPAQKGQVLTLKNAYESTGVDPSTITMLEAHGTGTKVGDEVELSSLNHFFEKADIPQGIALGSVKSQIGHTRTSAGMASLIKVMLSLYYKTLPLTANISEPNSAVKVPFYLNTVNRPWFANKNHPRRAGINSFGFGGTNFHAIVEEYVDATKKIEWDVNFTPAIFLFSAETLPHMLEKCRAIAELIQGVDGLLHYKTFCESASDSVNNPVRLSIWVKDFQQFKCYLFEIIARLEKSEINIQEKHYSVIQHAILKPLKIAMILPDIKKARSHMGSEFLLRFPELQSLFPEQEETAVYLSRKLYEFLLNKAEIIPGKIVLCDSGNLQYENIIPLGESYEEFLYALVQLWQYGVAINPTYFQPTSVHPTALQDKNKKFTIKINGGRYFSESTAIKIEASFAEEKLIARGVG